MNARARTPIAALRERVRAACELGDLTDLSSQQEELDADPRAGARALAERCRRFIRAAMLETERVAALFALRRRMEATGVRWVAGVDEVGVGPLAGPVVAAAVVLPQEVELPGLDDSKRLSPERREHLSLKIREQAEAFAIGEVAVEEIDRINILNASLEAMRRAVSGLPGARRPDHVLVDARRIPGIDMPQTAIVHGDAIDGSIAAASIVAKVHRDALMKRLDLQHPQYGFRQNMGYPTPPHLKALKEHGPCAVHRRSFRPVANAVRP